ncbi:MAG: 30S ribosomal protein S1 [Proteobacteria bacterium]|jgi:small subunit ribosomal protein S1|nr:30S ribosomal protein S1 [Pseudomonadota bacterium]MDA0908426.1 30S ribosomal protein S1 [Pseudomonadota bacterium]MDA1319339.1 30S ribosomal protein S1 [Pseudomonadota bacterium]
MKENFADLLAESFNEDMNIEGSVVVGTVVSLEKEAVIIDVGLKSEGRVALKEFTAPGQELKVNIGDQVEVYVERLEDRNGQALLSRDKARREEAWAALETAHDKQERVTGIIFGKVKGGFTVDLDGAIAFLPGSQVDIRPVRDLGPLMDTPQPFQILKIDRKRGNIVVSRRAVLEESRAEARSELVSNLSEGQILNGIVKNLTEYGAFVDLGGVDGLLHVTDIAWRRINHPSEVLSVGETVEVQVIRFNSETQRISLGMKQLQEDPWEAAKANFTGGNIVKGRVTNITDYGAFIELADGVEGLVHVSEMSWTKKNVHPGKIVSTSQEVDVMVLDVDMEKRRISLGIKQCIANPWEDFAQSFKAGSEIEGEIRNITEFGLFVGLNEEIDGLVHLTDISWDVQGDEAIQSFKKGDMVKAKVLEVDVTKERISLGIKQLTEDTVGETLSNIKKGDIVTCTITKSTDGGLEVSVGDNLQGFIRRSDLSRDRDEQRPERFAEGEKVDAQVTMVDGKARKLSLSIKAREMTEEKQAMASFGSSDSGASLGDILGAALAKRDTSSKESASKDDNAEESKPKATKAKAKSDDS